MEARISFLSYAPSFQGLIVMYSQKEMDLALKYSLGELNDTQLNYWVVQDNLEVEKIISLAKTIESNAYYFRIIKYVLVFIFFYILFNILF